MEIPQSISEILAKLEASGHEAYIVGGCVRDSLMGVQPNDYDITTSALPDEIMAVFKGYKVIPTGLKHGTVTVLVDSEPVEITTYRVDGDYADGRHPDNVRFTRSIDEDISRRDFTMNGIAYSPERGLHDSVGGAEDIRSGTIRCIGDPVKRFSEDALRIMRALRFSAVLGFEIEQATSEAIVSCRELLSKVAGERILVELKKLICGRNALAVLRGYPKVFTQIIPELAPCIGYDQHSRWHSLNLYEHLITAVANTPPDAGLRIAMLLHDVGKPLTQSADENGEWHYYSHAHKSMEIADTVLSRFHADNALRNRVKEIIRYHDMVPENTTAFIRKRLSKHGIDMFRDIMLAHIADNSAQADIAKQRIPVWREIIRNAEKIASQQPCLNIKQLAINGNDLASLIKPSPKLGETLKYLLNGVLEGRFENNRDELFVQARRYLDNGG